MKRANNKAPNKIQRTTAIFTTKWSNNLLTHLSERRNGVVRAQKALRRPIFAAVVSQEDKHERMDVYLYVCMCACMQAQSCRKSAGETC